MTQNQLDLLKILSQVGSGVFAGISGWQQGRDRRGANYADSLIALQNQRGGMFQSRVGDLLQQQQMLQSGGRDAASLIGGPMALAEARQRMGLRRSFLFGGPGGAPQYFRPSDPAVAAHVPSMPDFSGSRQFFTDRALAASELPFWQAIAQVSGGRIGGDVLRNAPYQGVEPLADRLQATAENVRKELADQQAARERIYQDWNRSMDATQMAVAQALQQERARQRKRSWLGRILSMAAPFVAAPFTGGASLAIGAGLGAIGGALQGGPAGALLGGALGGFGARFWPRMTPMPTGTRVPPMPLPWGSPTIPRGGLQAIPPSPGDLGIVPFGR